MLQYTIDDSHYLKKFSNIDTTLVSYCRKIRNALAHGDAVEANRILRTLHVTNFMNILERLARYMVLKSLKMTEDQINLALSNYIK